MGLNAQQIAELLQAGDASSYHDAASTSKKLTKEFIARTTTFNSLLGKMKAAWTGDSSDAAATSLSALQEAFTVSSDNIHEVSMKMETQGEAFTSVKNEIGPGPGPKPELDFFGKYLPIFSDQDEKLEKWNEEAARVVEAYNRYAKSTNENASSIPRSYGELVGGPEGLKFSVEDSGGGGGKKVGGGFKGGSNNYSGHTTTSGYTGGPISSDPTGLGTYGGGSGTSGTGGGTGTSGTGGVGGVNLPGGPGGTGGTGSSTLPSGGQSGSLPGGLPPGAVRLPNDSIPTTYRCWPNFLRVLGHIRRVLGQPAGSP